jgi:hypothetical protein
MGNLAGYLKEIAIVLAGGLLLLGMLSCASMPAKTVSAASLVITPISGQAASVITIRGSGFVPGEKIEVIMLIDGIPTELGEEPMIKEANEVGAFKAKSGIPFNAKPGVYSVKALGDKGTMAVAPLEVEKKEEKK